MKIKVKLFFRKDFNDETKRVWGLCVLTVNGKEHITSDIRAVYDSPDEMCVCTSLNGISGGTLAEKSPYNEEMLNDYIQSKYFELKEFEAEVIETDWNNRISHTYLKHKDIIC